MRGQSVLGPVMRGARPRGLIACPATAAAIVLLCAGPCLAQAPEDIVTAQRAHYGERVSPAEAPILLRAIAAELTQTFGTRYGLLVKTSGNNCGSFACDVICDANHDHWDVFRDGPDASVNYAGLAVPSWQPNGSIGDRTCALVDAAAPPASGGTPPSGPARDALTKGDLDALVDLLGQHDQEVRRLLENVYQQNERIYADLTQRLEARPIVTPPITVPDPVVPQLASGSPAGAIALFVVKYVLPAALAYVGGTKK